VNTGDQDLTVLLTDDHLDDFIHEDIAHTNRADLDNVSGTNTGDETLETIIDKLAAADPKVSLVAGDTLFIADSEATGEGKAVTYGTLITELESDLDIPPALVNKLNITAALSPYTITDINNNEYAVDLTAGNVVINLPEVTALNEGSKGRIYIELNPLTANHLTINTFGTQPVRGQTSHTFYRRFDGLTLTAHTYGTNHWDASDWTRTDEVIVQAGKEGTNTIATLQQYLSFMNSAGQISGCEVNSNGDGTISVATGEWFLRSSNSSMADCRAYPVPAVASIIIPEDNSYLYIDYNGGTPVWGVTTDITTIPCTDRCVQASVWRRGTTVHWIYLGNYTNDFAAQYARQRAATAWLQHGGGVKVGTTSGLTVSHTAGAFYQGNIRFSVAAFDSSVAGNFQRWYRDGAGGWTVQTNAVELGTTLYDDGDGTLAAIPSNRRACWWLFALVGNPTQLVAVYPQVLHNSLAAAELEKVPSTLPSFTEPFSIGKLIGKYIVKGSVTSFATAPISPFEVPFSQSAVATHNDLSGLQGGTADQYYHLTAPQHTIATQAASDTVAGYVTTEAQTLAGVKTVAAAPELPSSDPTTENQATRKSYVDKKSIINAIIFG
jgi:hypothetical protein